MVVGKSASYRSFISHIRQCFPECLHVFLGNTTFHKRAQARWLHIELLSRKSNHHTGDVILPYDSAHTEPPKNVLHFLFIAVSLSQPFPGIVFHFG